MMFEKLRKNMKERREERKAEKSRMREMESEERGKLERSFIRKKMEMKLKKKYTPEQFRIEQAQMKARIAKLNSQIHKSGSMNTGDRLLGNIGGYGFGQPSKKKKRNPPPIQLY